MVLPKTSVKTVSFIDEYCNAYNNIFPEVRTFENFKFLHLGMMSEIEKKSLTKIAKLLGLNDSQPLNHFLKKSPWDVKALRLQRLMWLKKKLNNRAFVLVIKEIGGIKKGKTTDYVEKQYINRLAKTERGIVSVNAYGVLEEITFPLMFKVFKPKRSQDVNEQHRTKPQLAAAIIKELDRMGFNFKLVVADKMYRTDPEVVKTITNLSGEFWLPNAKTEALNTKYKNKSVKPNTSEAIGDLTEIKSSASSDYSWHLPVESQLTKMPRITGIYNSVNSVGVSFKEVERELGWGDFRVTNYRTIEKWWEIVFSVYWMISLHSDAFKSEVAELEQQEMPNSTPIASICDSDSERRWHHRLMNLKSFSNTARSYPHAVPN